MNADWHAMFALQVAPLELIVRGTVIYWFLFLVFRFVMRRDIGSMGISDILLLVIIADAAQNAMSAEYRSITDGLVLISTILAWNFLLDWSSWRFPALRPILQGRPLIMVRDGHVIDTNLRRQRISRDELIAKLREHGVEQIAEVKRAWLEADGEISVIKHR